MAEHYRKIDFFFLPKGLDLKRRKKNNRRSTKLGCRITDILQFFLMSASEIETFTTHDRSLTVELKELKPNIHIL